MTLDVLKISAGYGRIQVLWDISLTVGNSEIVALIGANGAGKSTLLKVVMGVVRQSSGDVIYNGSSLRSLRPHSVVHRSISYVPEGRRLFPEMSVKENIRMGAPARCNDLKERFDRVFLLFPVLKDRRTQQASTLSGGEQQMVAIGRALMSNPQLLLLDELSFGLSPIMFENVLSAIEKIRENGVSILMAEQNSERALEVSDRTYVLENGKIMMTGKSSDLIDDPRIQTAYLGVVS
ncbi:MAG: ABC transporter ATP-binding protein [Thaumarchaeota archaeon]|nr:ABC transporter ATP-binding protein [Nitrososphaerota archaeon]